MQTKTITNRTHDYIYKRMCQKQIEEYKNWVRCVQLVLLLHGKKVFKHVPAPQQKRRGKHETNLHFEETTRVCTSCFCSTGNNTITRDVAEEKNKDKCYEKDDVFCKVRQVRNEILHSSTMQISDTDLEKIFSKTVLILKGISESKARPDIQQSIKEIEQLKRRQNVLTKDGIEETLTSVEQLMTEREKEIHTLVNDIKVFCDLKNAAGKKQQVSTRVPPCPLQEKNLPEKKKLKLEIDRLIQRLRHIYPVTEIDDNKIGKMALTKIQKELEELESLQRNLKRQMVPPEENFQSTEGGTCLFSFPEVSFMPEERVVDVLELSVPMTKWKTNIFLKDALPDCAMVNISESCTCICEEEKLLRFQDRHTLLSKQRLFLMVEFKSKTMFTSCISQDCLNEPLFKNDVKKIDFFLKCMSNKHLIFKRALLESEPMCIDLDTLISTNDKMELFSNFFKLSDTGYSFYRSTANKNNLFKLFDEGNVVNISVSNLNKLFICSLNKRTINPMKIFNAWQNRHAYRSLGIKTDDKRNDTNITFILNLLLKLSSCDQHCHENTSVSETIKEDIMVSEEIFGEVEGTDTRHVENLLPFEDIVSLHVYKNPDLFVDSLDSRNQKLNDRKSENAEESTVSLKSFKNKQTSAVLKCKVLNETVDLVTKKTEGEELLSLSKDDISEFRNEEKEKEHTIKQVIKGNPTALNNSSTYTVAPVTNGKPKKDGSKDKDENTAKPSASGNATSQVKDKKNDCSSKTKKHNSKKPSQNRTESHKSESLTPCCQPVSGLQTNSTNNVEVDAFHCQEIESENNGPSSSGNEENGSKISTDGHTSTKSLNVLKDKSGACMPREKLTSLPEGAVRAQDAVTQISCAEPHGNVSKPIENQTCLKGNPENLHVEATSSSNEDNLMAYTAFDAIQTNGNMATSSHTSIIDNETRSSHTSIIDNETRIEEFPNPHIDPSVIQRFEPLMTIVDKIANGERVPPQITMRYEMLRFCTLRSYPKENKPFITRIAEAGFYYANVDDEVVCYCCARRKRNWRENDIPMDVHRQLNPNCKFLRRNSEVNVPIKTDVSTVNAHASSETPIMSSSSPHSHIPQKSYIGGYVGSENSVQHSQQIVNFGNTPGNTLNQNEIRQDELVSSSSCSRVSSEIFPQTQTRAHGNFAQGSIARPVEYQRQNAATASSTSGLGNSGHNNTSQSANQGSAMPKYPKYASKTVRLSSFNDCNDIVVSPDYLSVAGFFYAGFGDCVRCFQCGVGLRHWSEEDDPWIEHSRWSKDCSFVRQMRGEEFVSIVQQAVLYSQNQNRQENNQSSRSGNVTGNGNENGGGEIERLLHTDSAQSVLEMGYHPDLIRRAIRGVLEVHGRSGISAYNLMEKIFEMEAAESGINTEQNDEDTEERTRSTNSSISRRTGLDSFSNSSLDRSAESQPQVGAEGRSSATIDNKGAQSAHAGTSDLKKASKKSQLLEQKKLKEENEMLKQQSICTVCKERDVCIVFLPCGHLVTCETCAPTVRNCTVQTCGRYIKGTVRTYLG